MNRLTGTVDPLGGLTVFGYDPNGNLLTVTDARGHTTTHEYDPLDRLSRRIDPLGQAETFLYDGMGNLTSTTDRKNQTTAFTYDPLHRRTRAAYADGAVATFAYDAGGRLLQADDTADPHRPITRQYDVLDRLLTETTSLGTMGYQYDPLGRRVALTVGGQAPVRYTYDASSRLRTITQAPLAPAALDYDAANRRTLVTLPNGVSTEYQYDVASRLTALLYRNALGPLGDLTYAYDAVGNRLGVGGSWARTLLPAPVPAASYDPANRQGTFGPVTQAFDDTGNLLTQTDPSGTMTYTWDARNRLTGLSSSTTSAQFAYDGLGRRVSRVLNGASTAYLYDGLDAIRESGAGGEATYLRTLNIDEALVRTDAGDPVHFLADALGGTVALTAADGTAGTTYTYAPFGETGVAGPPSLNPVQFTGRENDGTGLYYYRARYYDPGRGRFVSEDPAGWSGGFNLFAYAVNAPLTYLDAFGLAPLTLEQITALVAQYNQSSAPNEVIIAQAWKESGFDPRAVPTDRRTGELLSSARGLLQVTKGAARDVGVDHDDLFDAATNIEAGTSYLQNRLDLVERRRKDLTDPAAQLTRALELYGTGAGYGNDIMGAAACLKGRKAEPMKCLHAIRK